MRIRLRDQYINIIYFDSMEIMYFRKMERKGGEKGE